MHLFMRSVLLAGFLTSFLPSDAQQGIYPSRIIQYLPAPGQHINHPSFGVPACAELLTSGTGQGVSLGSYGGFLVVAFDQGIQNDPDNPYGVDFVILGNAFLGSPEPAIVQVMRDDNNNGIPDETWYELAGSYHHTGKLLHDFKITYYRPASSESNVEWITGEGLTGLVPLNSFYTQPYFPTEINFPDVIGNHLTFSGNRLPLTAGREGGILKADAYLFGYADNRPPVPGGAWLKPDNPYTPDVAEGMGGDAFDIGWAVDKDGKRVVLNEIHFIRIFNAVFLHGGEIGEFSTDITGIADIPPNPGLKGPNRLLSLESVENKYLARTSTVINPILFSYGIPVPENFLYTSSDTSVLNATGNVIQFKKTGSGRLEVRGAGHGDIAARVVQVIEPGSFLVDGVPSSVQPGQEFFLKVLSLDLSGDVINETYPNTENLNPDILETEQTAPGIHRIKALQAGTARIRLKLENWPEKDSLLNFVITEKQVQRRISFLAKTGNENLIPRKEFLVRQQNIELFMDRGMPSEQAAGVSLASAIADALLQSGFSGSGRNFRFRSDQYSGDHLYLWQIARDWEFLYGWGGSTSPGYESAWVIILNDSVVIRSPETIEIHDGDAVSLIYLPDHTIHWSNICLVPDVYLQEEENPVEFIATLTSWALDEAGSFERIGYSRVEIPALHVKYPGDNAAPESSYEFVKDGIRFRSSGVFHVFEERDPYEKVEISAVATAEDMKKTDLVELYPNPCREVLSLRGLPSGKINYRITDPAGKIWLTGYLTGEEKIYVDACPPGLYCLILQDRKQTYTYRFIKE